jgi:4-hydroxy-tetrahydrodipicolinate synthase
VGDRATIIAGVGTNDTAHSVAVAKSAATVGAHGVMAVTPYYNRPPQEGIIAHFHAIADATDLPMLTYDIPKRTGTAIETETIVRIAEHPRIVANKDAKGDLDSAQWGMARTDLAWYCGDDILNLPMIAIGGAGMISVVGHLVGDRLKAMADAYAAGDIETAREINASLLPVYTGVFRTQGVILTKAALAMQGLPSGPVRLPLVDATEAQKAQLRADLAAGRVSGFTA